MNKTEFMALSTEKIADLVRKDGGKIFACPVNGTRRWFTLEFSSNDYENIQSGYLDKVAEGYVGLFKMLFDHGIETLLTPSFGPDLMERGSEYMQVAAEGFSRLTSHPLFLEFYESYGVRVRFYGDYVKAFEGTPYASLGEEFDDLSQKTGKNTRHRLFFGLFAHDASETVADFAVQFYQSHKRAPARDEIVAGYYGEQLGPVDVFIGFDKFTVFDLPLVALGEEDLYFSVCPTLYLSQEQLRAILWDHLFERKSEEDYTNFTPENWKKMEGFYRNNREKTLGIGQKVDGIWYPLPQVRPFEDTDSEK